MTVGCFAGFSGFDCSLLWICMILLFFIIAILRRQLGEYVGIEINLIGGIGGAIIPFILLIYLTHSFKWAFLAGLLGGIIGGIFVGQFFGTGGGEYDFE